MNALLRSSRSASVGLGLLFSGILAGCGGAAAHDAVAPSGGSMEAPATMAAGPSEKAAAGGSVASLSGPTPPPARMTSPPTSPTTSPIVSEPAHEQYSAQLTAGVWDDNRNFDFFKPYASRFAGESNDLRMFTDEEQKAARAASSQLSSHTDLDVQIVLDTTGSMGDELEYLKKEVDLIAASLHTRFPNVTPRWSLVVYRDKGDAYVARGFDFTDDTTRFRQALGAQSADGGGDTPEAVVDGLSTGLQQRWRDGQKVAKVAFWVADAPAHPGQGRLLANVLRQAQRKGIHLYPVASSDTDPTAEYEMRSAAQITGGRYIFLTDDSGVGNGHAEPHIPCYGVTRLDHAMVRMLSIEISGRYTEASPQETVRKVGTPDATGHCKTSSGMLVASY
jgi:von Willebrand factor type A domain